MRALEDALVKEWEAIKWEVEGLNGLKGQEREGEGDDDDARSVILSFRTSRRALS
jgi:hypothetical protein